VSTNPEASHPAREATAIYLDEKLTPADQDLLGRFIARLGIAAKFTTIEPAGTDPDHNEGIESLEFVHNIRAPQAQLEKIYKNGFRFQDISSPSDILVVEHLYNLAESRQQPTNAYTIAWGQLTNGGAPAVPLTSKPTGVRPKPPRRPREWGWDQIAEPTPLQGAALVKRSSSGLPRYVATTKHTSPTAEVLARDYGVLVGSLGHALSPYMFSSEGELGSKSKRILRDIGLLLGRQVEAD
jgi:hypothetical protein